MEKIINLDKKIFIRIYNKFSRHKKGFEIITTISKPFYIIIYSLLLAFLVYKKDFDNLFLCIIIPLSVMITCKILRKLIGRKRPFIEFQTINLPIKKDASFPSNHTASSFIISFVFLLINIKFAIFLIFIAFLVSISRIIVGLHFPLDVFCAFLISLSFFLVFISVY